MYNLGEIIGDSAEAFELSYLENALTSNPVLNRLATRARKDVLQIIKLAERGEEGPLDLEGEYSPDELADYVAVLKKLLRVRDVVLAVNREYIRSAAVADDYRTEPAFKLQGSYRNMNRIAERVTAVQNDDELQTLILSTYENDAQTLTSDAEANLLKLRELMRVLTEQEKLRWESIKETFQRNLKLRVAGDDDQFSRLMVQVADVAGGLGRIREAIANAADKQVNERHESLANPAVAQQVLSRLEGVNASLAALAETAQHWGASDNGEEATGEAGRVAEQIGSLG